MSSFQDRFKGKAVIVGRDGENALLPGSSSNATAQRGSSLSSYAPPPNPPSRSTTTTIRSLSPMHPGRAVAPISSAGSSQSPSLFQQQQQQQQQQPAFNFKPGAMISAHPSQQQLQQQQQTSSTRLPPIASAVPSAAPRSAPAQGRSGMLNRSLNDSRSSSSATATRRMSNSQPMQQQQQQQPVATPPPATNEARNPFGTGAGAISLFGGGNGNSHPTDGGHISLFGGGGGTNITTTTTTTAAGPAYSPLRASPQPSHAKPLSELGYNRPDEDSDDDVGMMQTSALHSHHHHHQKQQPTSLQPENFFSSSAAPSIGLPPPGPAPSSSSSSNAFPGARGMPAPPPFSAVSPKSIWESEASSSVGTSPAVAERNSMQRPTKKIVLSHNGSKHNSKKKITSSHSSSKRSTPRNQQQRPHHQNCDQHQQQQGGDQEELTSVTASEYKKYTLDDFRRLKEQDVAAVNKPRARGLGPNDSDDVRKARELRNRAKEYGESNNKINITVLPFQAKVSQPPAPVPTADVVDAKERRERAREFARHVPKPKVRDVSALVNNTSNSNNSSSSQNAGGFMMSPTSTHGMSPKQLQAVARRDKLMELEVQHERMVQMVEALKKQLKM